MYIPNIVLVLLLYSIEPVFSSNGKVRLTDVKVLTLTEGYSTTGRRSASVPQLTCTAGSACSHSNLKPKTVQCYNQGSDGFDVQWKCNADLDNSVKFGRTEVTCEGYDYPDDPYILKGSCGLEYTLEFVNGAGSGSSYFSSPYSETKASPNVPSTLSNFTSMLCIVGLILFLLWFCSSSRTGENMPRSSGSGPMGGGGGGGGGFGWGNGPRPPPYDDPSSYDSGPSCGSAYNRNNFGFAPNYQRGNGAGFWSGLAAGGLMGYMFGGNRNRNNYDGNYNPNRHGSYSGWGGGSSSPGFSGGSRNATGFGGTRRR